LDTSANRSREGTEVLITATSNTSGTQVIETASDARKRKAVSVLQSGIRPPAIRTAIPVPEGWIFISPHTKEEVDANPDLSYYLFQVSRDGDIEENKNNVAAIKFQPPGLTMSPAQARQFPLLRRVTMLDMSFVRRFESEDASRYIYE
jgi:hypothetical protein